MVATTELDLPRLRRAFHRHPEPAWREFHTTARLVEEVRSIGVDELAVGPEAYDPDDRMAAPDADSDEVRRWMDRAIERGADEELVEQMAGGNTGLVAVLDRQDGADGEDGPHVGLRVDIDGLFIEESADEEHLPVREGFRSETEETMHACGHDAHMTWGLAVLDAVKRSDFAGRFTVFFQPAEEVSGGGHPMAESEYAAGLDSLFAVHVGLDHPTGEVVAGVEEILAMCHVDATFRGTSAHAGKAPNEGDNAMQALGTAIQNAYGIPRHADGMTRVNIGVAEAGTASNIIAEKATIHGEARGETTELMEYMKSKLSRTLDSAAEMHGCEADVEIVSESPRVDSDPELAGVVADAAAGVDGVETVTERAAFGASEDATFLMDRAHREGGRATFLIVGTDHPTSHHTATFDVDERSLPIGVEVLTKAVLAAGEGEPGAE
ncbi:amidohydrolase [Halogeometricum pallidum JCM 14848]|uniref:Amidohydrolase n=1 Tax=Halogeometricum pallidum JCM 14848 TaxID=1227487 RepID=M0DBC4_HALPD|nr:amidohydrolase [Halogeometricum pallidum]ELZ31479.1 amidohydrolase [Halogeometricum pallidum JCM 14848]